MTSSHRINAEAIADILLAPIHEVEESPSAGSSSASNKGVRAGRRKKLCLVIHPRYIYVLLPFRLRSLVFGLFAGS